MSQVKTITRNFAILSAGTVTGRIVSFATAIYLTRVLGTDGFGMIVFATAALAYAELLVDCGFDNLGPLEVARGIIPPQKLVGIVMALRLIMTVVGFGGLALFAFYAPMTADTRTVVLLYGTVLIATVIDVKYVFLGSERMHVFAVTEVASQAITAAGAFFLVKDPSHVMRMPWIFLVARLAAMGGQLYVYARRYGVPWPFLEMGLVRRLLKSAIPLGLSGSVGMLIQNFDVLLIGIWMTTAHTGLYGAAYRVVWIPTMFTVSYYSALRPSIARGFVTGYASIEPMMIRSLRLTTAAATGLLVGGTLLAEPVVRFLYGNRFAGAAEPLRILLWSPALVMVNRQFRMLLVAFEHQWVAFRLAAFSAGINVILNVLLIKRYGLVGAACATMVSELVFLAVGAMLTRKLIAPLPLLKSFAKPVVCGAVMGLAIWLTPHWPVVLRIFIGSGVYLVMLFAFGVFSTSEVRAFVKAVRPAPSTT